jgi:hypothetical protein
MTNFQAADNAEDMAPFEGAEDMAPFEGAEDMAPFEGPDLMMGLSEWGEAVLGEADARIKERLARIRRRLVNVGVPSAVAGAALTTLIFAGAFKVANTERAWAPAFVLGGAALVAGLARVAAAHAGVAALEKELEQETTTTPKTMEA